METVNTACRSPCVSWNGKLSHVESCVKACRTRMSTSPAPATSRRGSARLPAQYASAAQKRIVHGDFAESPRFEDVDFDDFTTFLEIVHPPHKSICGIPVPFVRPYRRYILGENIAAVMPLADSFGAKIILERCEQFLVDEMDLSKAIPTLEKFSLNELKVRWHWERRHTRRTYYK